MNVPTSDVPAVASVQRIARLQTSLKMSSSSSSLGFGLLMSRDKGSIRLGQPALKNTKSIKTECRGVLVPESHHDAVLNEVSSSQKNKLHKLPTIEELNSKKHLALPYLFEGSIDLRPLTSLLSPASEVFEADVLWDFDSVMDELSSLEVKLKNNDRRDTAAHVHGCNKA